MNKAAIVIGVGSGLGVALVEKYGHENFTVGMISRTEEKLAKFQKEFKTKGIQTEYETCDAGDEVALKSALLRLKEKLGRVDLVHYNAVDYRYVHILEDSIDDLTKGYRMSVLGALVATKTLIDELAQNHGVILLTGGAAALKPSPQMASISLAKAGIRNLTEQLAKTLKDKNIYVGSLLVNGAIDPNSSTHSPTLLADQFWKLYQNRSEVEVIY